MLPEPLEPGFTVRGKRTPLLERVSLLVRRTQQVRVPVLPEERLVAVSSAQNRIAQLSLPLHANACGDGAAVAAAVFTKTHELVPVLCSSLLASWIDGFKEAEGRQRETTLSWINAVRHRAFRPLTLTASIHQLNTSVPSLRDCGSATTWL